MIVLQILAMCLAGGAGAALRFVVDGAIRHHSSSSYPLATLVVNVTGSLLLGMLVGLVLGGVLSPGWQLVVGTGMMGGYTTFSTASYETVRLLEDRRWWAATINSLGMLVICTAAAAGGYVVGVWL